MKVLVVEDEAMVAMLIEDMVASCGHSPMGPAATLEEAHRCIEEGGFDVALLDVNLGGQACGYDIADTLTALSVPFAFVSGYASDGLASRYSHVPRLQKPFMRNEFSELMEKLNSRVT